MKKPSLQVTQALRVRRDYWLIFMKVLSATASRRITQKPHDGFPGLLIGATSLLKRHSEPTTWWAAGSQPISLRHISGRIWPASAEMREASYGRKSCLLRFLLPRSLPCSNRPINGSFSTRPSDKPQASQSQASLRRPLVDIATRCEAEE